MASLLSMRNITKRFPGVLANDHINFDVDKGEIHALVGENGAGKTTLMNILYGLYHADEGSISLRGEEVEVNNPREAIRLGIGMVHQHFMLVHRFSVAENVALGLKSSRGMLLETNLVSQRLQEISEQYGLQVDPSVPIWQLPVGVQQRVEILKALYRGAELLVLDEPTAVLTPQETEGLFDVLRSLAGQGHAIVFISHKLGEVTAISDRITVLRSGQVVGTVERTDANPALLARMMVGRDVAFTIKKEPATDGQTILRVSNLSCYDERGQKAVRDISFDLRRGEILGVAGVLGNGQAELAEALAGLRPKASGCVLLDDRDITRASPHLVATAGLTYVPADRRQVGSIGHFSLSENAILKRHRSPRFSRAGLAFRRDAIADYARRLVDEYDIRTPHIGVEARTLSGGNLQKLIVAREVSGCTKVLIAVHPARGLDLATIGFVQEQLLELRQRGIGILLVSTELNELLSLSDRIAVIYEGQILDILPGEAADREYVGLLMAGLQPEAERMRRL
jgi:simple sugar transport system ATP-binding protein